MKYGISPEELYKKTEVYLRYFILRNTTANAAIFSTNKIKKLKERFPVQYNQIHQKLCDRVDQLFGKEKVWVQKYTMHIGLKETENS